MFADGDAERYGCEAAESIADALRHLWVRAFLARATRKRARTPYEERRIRERRACRGSLPWRSRTAY